jgi:hypothetical protein
MSAVPVLKRILSVAFFPIVMDAWLLKLEAFIVRLTDQPWVQTQFLFLSVVVTVVATPVAGAVASARAGWTTEHRNHQASRTYLTLVQVKGSSS